MSNGLDMSTRTNLRTSGPEAALHEPRVLVVEPDPGQAQDLAQRLAEEGYEAQTCTGLRRLQRLLASAEFDVVVCASEVADVAAVLALCDGDAPPSIVLRASFGSIHEAVEAMRAGASDYLTEPVSEDQLLLAVARAAEGRRLRAENRRLRADLGERYELGRIHSRDAAMRRVFETLEAVADTRATILIEGESGTGKSLLARSIHQRSARRTGPFVEVNCGALPANLLESELFGHVRGAFTGAIKDRPGKFETADGGTIFLDEIATASAELQVKLLRVLQERQFERVGDSQTRSVDTRVIAATNAELTAEVEAGRFREDLYYRLHVVAVRVPPLRARPTDVPLLAEQFVARFAREHGRDGLTLSDEALARLTLHAWPGNVRELENALERAVLLARGGQIGSDDLPDELPACGSARRVVFQAAPAEPGAEDYPSLREALEGPERAILIDALRRNGGRRQETARMLQVNRATLFNKMRKYGLLSLSFE
jgi:DNA-binding NtrC family response regulator